MEIIRTKETSTSAAQWLTRCWRVDKYRVRCPSQLKRSTLRSKNLKKTNAAAKRTADAPVCLVTAPNNTKGRRVKKHFE